MAKPKRTFKTKAEREAHEARLAKRREKHRQAVTMRMAIKAAEEGATGETDFATLVEAERQRHETVFQTAGRKGASMSPKVTTAARDNLAAAFDLMGGVPALVVWGRANPTEFYRIWARLIPRESADATSSLPLESLLEKLATKEELSVGEAAREIGEEVIEEGRKRAAIEDANYGPRPEEIN